MTAALPPMVLRGVDRAAFAAAFALRLRAAGILVDVTAIEGFTRALSVCAPDSRKRLYWVARIALMRRLSELESFDAGFAAVFDDVVLGLDPVARRAPRVTLPGDDDVLAAVPAGAGEESDGAGLPWHTLPTVVDTASGTDSDVAVPLRLPSDLEELADIPFEQLDADRLALLSGWLESALATWPTRRSRRLVYHRAGRRVALRATLAQARRTGWEPITLVCSRATRKPRPVVMLCDVSQSMQAHSTAYLHLMRAAALTTNAEVFAFATSLTRLTAVLAHRSPEVAIELATATVTDRFAGTRIASNMRALLGSRHGGALRGAIVIVASDGWDSDDPAELGAAMARLHRRAHCIIWMNPRAAAPGFEPLTGAMAAALPYCDELLPADTIRALADVVAAIGRAGSRHASSKGSRGRTGGSG